MENLLDIKNLTVSVDTKNILKNLNLSVNKGEVHIIMGPNGAGKSTLANVIMGHPKYHIEQGDIFKLENYCTKWGIKQNKFKKDFVYDTDFKH